VIFIISASKWKVLEKTLLASMQSPCTLSLDIVKASELMSHSLFYVNLHRHLINKAACQSDKVNLNIIILLYWPVNYNVLANSSHIGVSPKDFIALL